MESNAPLSPPKTNMYASPKRKRRSDSPDSAPSPIRLRTDLPSRPLEVKLDTGSPRTKVTRQLQAMDIQQEHGIPHLDFGRNMEIRLPPTTVPIEQELRFKDIAFTNSSASKPAENETENPPSNPSATPQPPTITSPTPPNENTPLTPPKPNSTSTSTSKSKSTTPPATPHLHPTSPSTPRTISPLPTRRLKSPPPPPPPTLPLPLPQFPSPTQSPPQPNSPPTSWQASEITGHAPTDPLDDGYGINGIGFRPTPAMAYARTQRRKQQVAEWKSREAREARQRRSERRREMGGGTRSGAVSSGPAAGAGVAAAMEMRGRRVRFVEG